jgi:hypothetical protein
MNRNKTRKISRAVEKEKEKEKKSNQPFPLQPSDDKYLRVVAKSRANTSNWSS